MIVLRLKSEMKIFLLKKDIIGNQQTVRKQKQVQVKLEIIHLLLTKKI